MTGRTAQIAEFLEARGAAPAAAERAGAAIASAWAAREFWFSATAEPLRECAADSPAMAGESWDVAELVDQLARRCGVHVHPVPEWEPT